MSRDNQPWSLAPAPALAWEDGVPCSTAFDDVYFSRDDGLAETRHVFLAGNRLPGRWRDWRERSFTILETGFGTGLNFLATWQAWRELPAPRPQLHYIAVEQFPLRRPDLDRSLAAWQELAPLADALRAGYPPAVRGCHRLLLDNGALRLDLWWTDIDSALADLASHDTPQVDAWYLDGFAPARNDGMWQASSWRQAAALSRPGATFSTFTAVGQVRRGLAAAGFTVRKRAGHGRKRECLHGELSGVQHTRSTPAQTPWDLPASRAKAPGTALVVGAGLAGCATAAALARRGVAVTVLDAGPVAGAASGNRQGVLYTRLSKRHSTLADFALASYLHAAAWYRELFAAGELAAGIDGSLCGTFAQQDNTAEMDYLREALAGAAELAQVLDPAQASQHLGVTPAQAGYWYPASGWLHPASVCRAALATPGIALLENCGDLALERRDGHWCAIAGDTELARADCAVVAAGTGSKGLAGLDWLPLQAIRGQTTQLASSPSRAALQAVLCHHGYITPADDAGHCIGATFGPNDSASELRAADHQTNLERLAGAVPEWASELADLDGDALAGRVGWRCASPDYLPLAGPVPDLEAFEEDFAPLRRNARAPVALRGRYRPGLYLNTAHGSRGLSSTPLCAELLASTICTEAPPLERSLCRALAPARFIMRQLIRNRT